MNSFGNCKLICDHLALVAQAIGNLVNLLCVIRVHEAEIAEVLNGSVEVRGPVRIGVELPQLSQKRLPLLRIQTRVRVRLQFEIPETTHSRSWEEDQ